MRIIMRLHDWDENLQSNLTKYTPDECWTKFKGITKRFFDLHVPIRKVKSQRGASWFNENPIKLIRQKNKFFNKY